MDFELGTWVCVRRSSSPGHTCADVMAKKNDGYRERVGLREGVRLSGGVGVLGYRRVMLSGLGEPKRRVIAAV